MPDFSIVHVNKRKRQSGGGLRRSKKCFELFIVGKEVLANNYVNNFNEGCHVIQPAACDC